MLRDRTILGVRLSTDNRPRVRDDRGELYPLLMPRKKKSCRFSRRERIANRMISVGTIAVALYVPVSIGGVIAFGLWSIRASSNAGMSGSLVTWSLIGVYALFGVPMLIATIYLLWPGRRTRVERAARLAEGVCASCEYGLAGLTPEPDACTICPECGAAWRLQ